MRNMLLTKSTTFIIGPVSSLLGYIMNAIFWLQSQIGLANIGLCIILFTIVIYMILTPLTIQQQKFSKLSSKMNPELQAIQKKYKGKTQDQAVAMKMNEETQAVYSKYGVNPMGNCLQLIVQMPILFALYRVIWNIPAYVSSVKDAFIPLAEKLMTTAGAQDYLSTAAKSLTVTFNEMTNLTVVDVLYKFKPANWTELSSTFPDLSSLVGSTQEKIDHMNNFIGLNIADSPMSIMTTAFKSGAILMVIGALMIPILAAVTQWLNSKLMSTVSASTNQKAGAEDTMGNTMKTMNTVMPLMSAVFCLSLPVGMGIYWIAGAVVRSIQQVVINKHIDKMDMDEIMKKNLEKANKKREKQGLPPQKITNNAKLNTRNIASESSGSTVNKNSKEDIQSRINKSTEYYNQNTNAKPGSLASKAQMVKQYNDKNHKK
ncbi:MAG: YidC/Oxa1 family membrane protein insertase [Lachnospiraceae bacterium]|nr:YidC/Oxa1 family membrane protein insertase [Lachnospiraceae bacterium]